MIKLVRCDDRLIHGQCITVITKVHSIQQIIIIDNFVASNPMMKRIFKLAIPSNMTGDVYNGDEAVAPVKEALTNNKNVLVLASSPIYYPNLFDKVEGLPKSVNIGPMSKRDQTTEIIYGTHLTKEELDSVESLHEKGVEGYFNAVPERERADWEDVRKKIHYTK